MTQTNKQIVQTQKKKETEFSLFVFSIVELIIVVTMEKDMSVVDKLLSFHLMVGGVS